MTLLTVVYYETPRKYSWQLVYNNLKTNFNFDCTMDYIAKNYNFYLVGNWLVLGMNVIMSLRHILFTFLFF